ncbi:hypothetical protein VP01_582g1 [Puccinia sorghi]|uniref:Uncharacterized protein n=1 Tax=Puccinia sorghi TaxID=27349 RepID=A0A0L6UIU4_9BASI|nr:hypothetical protein VP01_582g1 [Puccinia sorghi]
MQNQIKSIFTLNPNPKLTQEDLTINKTSSTNPSDHQNSVSDILLISLNLSYCFLFFISDLRFSIVSSLYSFHLTLHTAPPSQMITPISIYVIIQMRNLQIVTFLISSTKPSSGVLLSCQAESSNRLISDVKFLPRECLAAARARGCSTSTGMMRGGLIYKWIRHGSVTRSGAELVASDVALPVASLLAINHATPLNVLHASAGRRRVQKDPPGCLPRGLCCLNLLPTGSFPAQRTIGLLIRLFCHARLNFGNLYEYRRSPPLGSPHPYSLSLFASSVNHILFLFLSSPKRPSCASYQISIFFISFSQALLSPPSCTPTDSRLFFG